jgi:hypothetical protein
LAVHMTSPGMRACSSPLGLSSDCRCLGCALNRCGDSWGVSLTSYAHLVAIQATAHYNQQTATGILKCACAARLDQLPLVP